MVGTFALGLIALSASVRLHRNPTEKDVSRLSVRKEGIGKGAIQGSVRERNRGDFRGVRGGGGAGENQVKP